MKKFFTLDHNDFPVMLASSPVIVVANYLILGSSYVANLGVFVGTTLGLTALSVVVSWLMDAWMKFMRYRFAGVELVELRVTYCLIFDLVVTLDPIG